MSSIGSISGMPGVGTPPPGSARAATDASAELAKLECQLSDWVNCPSGKTSAGKARIAEITQQIDAIKTQAKHAEQSASNAAPATSIEGTHSVGPPSVRLDGLGTTLDVRA